MKGSSPGPSLLFPCALTAPCHSFVLGQCSVPCSHWEDGIGQIPQFSKRKRTIRTDEGWDLPLSGKILYHQFRWWLLIFHLSNASLKHRLQEKSWQLWNEGLSSSRAQIGQRVPLQGLASCHSPGSNLWWLRKLWHSPPQKRSGRRCGCDYYIR